MNSTQRILLIVLAFASLTSFKKTFQGDEWVYEREKKGIKVFTKPSKWGHFRDSKAQMQVNASPEAVLKILTDFDNYSTWFPRCGKSKLLSRPSANEYIVHLFFNAPWPIKNRDCIMRVKVERAINGTITVIESPEPKFLKQEDGVVRVTNLSSIWTLVPKNGGTELSNEYSSDPGGNIPDWLANTQSVENPIATFEGIKQKILSR